MRSEQLINRWVGVALMMVTVVGTLWLAASGRLTLYIHPRYTLFTVALAIIAGLIVTAALATRPEPAHPDHDPDHAHDSAGHPRPARDRILAWSRALIAISAAVVLLVLSPATLSSTTRQSRELVTTGQALDSDPPVLTGGNSATFSVKDWASVLSQGGSEAVLGKEVDVSGYVLDQGDDDVFFVARLLVSCCAVDAQPVGVPVYRPGWRQELDVSSWVAVQGTFVENPDPASPQPAAVKVSALNQVAEPDQPYAF